MRPLDDLLPEEKEPQHEELRNILQRAYREPILVPPDEQARIIARVWECLTQADSESPLAGDMPLPEIGRLDPSEESRAGNQQRSGRLVRLVNMLAAALVVAALCGLALLTFNAWHPSTGKHNEAHHGASVASLALSTTDVNFGQNGLAPQPVQVTLSNFASNARVVLTHDLQEAIQMTPCTASASLSQALVKIGAGGKAVATICVTTKWGFGYHTIYAEDIRSHTTASAGLLVTGAQPSLPAHLVITASLSSTIGLTTLALGPGIQGANTTQAIYLKNTSQSGSITWSAGSNQSWLQVTPNVGTFNQEQTVEVAVQRGNLPVGTYTGIIKFSSNVDMNQLVMVTMSVTQLPTNAAVIALSPAVLSFVTTDGATAAPPCQPLTISNPGSQMLNWSLATTAATTASTQLSVAQTPATSGNWLSASPSSGSISAASYQTMQICVQSAGLLPGAYLGTLQISDLAAADTPQAVSVSLTVQPHCGLTTSASFLTFTAVQGKTNPGSQGLGLSATASCFTTLTGSTTASTINWTAQVSTPSWLSVSPTRGTLLEIAGDDLTVSVNPAALRPQSQPYMGSLVFSTQGSTQTVLVSLLVQQPVPGAPILGASPLNLNFSSTLGQNPKDQVVTITNSGSSVLNWNSNPQPYTSWLTVSPTSGQVLPGQTGTVTISVDTTNLTPGSYWGQVTLNGADGNGNTASGSPQVISVNLVVQPSCTLAQPSLSSLAFTGVKGQPNPATQQVLISGTGNCVWPLLITTTVSPGASWLKTDLSNDTIGGNGQSTSLAIHPDIGNLKASAQPYTAQVTITATDSTGNPAQGSGQTIDVSLTVEPPCTLSAGNASLVFTMFQGAASSTVQAQTVALSEKGTCARPMIYTVTPSSGATWLSAPTPSPDTGNGSSLVVSLGATASGLAAGSYTGTIKITAVDTNNFTVGSVVLKVTLTVTAPTVSGTVYACTGTPPACLTQTPLPDATITVLSGSTTVATVTADASGNFTITGLPVGNYTANVSGTLAGVLYTAPGIPLNLSANLTGVNFNAYL